jgi:hypothetical protein
MLCGTPGSVARRTLIFAGMHIACLSSRRSLCASIMRSRCRGLPDVYAWWHPAGMDDPLAYVSGRLACVSGKVMILVRYYTVTDSQQLVGAPSRNTKLKVRVDWICLRDVAEQASNLPEQPRVELTAVMSTSIRRTIAAPDEGMSSQRVRATPISLRSSRDLAELLERIREAAVDYFASQIDEELLGNEGYSDRPVEVQADDC